MKLAILKKESGLSRHMIGGGGGWNWLQNNRICNDRFERRW